ncbi:MAG: hypothetical protein HRT45_15665 [Bdellovibrionales bacterium]|nr:hypothetical protein [Bdellovibrionales bacterium]
MFNSAFRLLLLASAVFFADLTLAQDGCRYPNQGDRRYHYGRQLVFLTEVLIDEIYESRECSRGYNRIGACTPSLQEPPSWLCTQGQMLMCNFCEQETEEGRALIERESGKSIEDFNRNCEVLRNTPPNYAKNNMDEATFLRTRQRILDSLERLIIVLNQFEGDVFNGITDDSGLSNGIPDTRFADQKTRYIGKVDLLFNGEENPESIFTEFGSSDTTSEILRDLAEYKTRWAFSLKTMVTSVEGMSRTSTSQALQGLASDISATRAFLDENWNYNPQTSCTYKDRHRR